MIFELDTAIELEAALPLRWSAPSGAVRSLRLVEKVRESEDVVSFLCAARDGGPLPDFEAGQHLPIEVEVPGRGQPLRRTCSLSSGPADDRYRITVKRAPLGQVSRRLHDSVEVGSIPQSGSPAGEFVLSPGSRSVVLLSAGIGLTPMVSMLQALARPDESRSVWFFHGVRSGRHHALAREVKQLVAGSDRIQRRVAYSRPGPEDRLGSNYHYEGRVDAEWVAQQMLDLDAEFYLCGPGAFLASLSDGLEARGVSPERIHAETLGPVQ